MARKNRRNNRYRLNIITGIINRAGDVLIGKTIMVCTESFFILAKLLFLEAKVSKISKEFCIDEYPYL